MALKYLYVPSGYKAGTAYGVLPNDSTADFDEFVRDTSATRTNKDGLVESMGNNVPRLDYSDGGCPSLLLETQRTNIAEYSENTLSWNVNPSNWGGTRTSNALTAPDGSNSADLISVIQQSGVYMQTMNVTAATTYSTSVYAKHISGTSTLKFSLTSNFYGGTDTFEKGIFVNLSDGSIISNTIGEFANVKVIDVGNGWYRLFLEGHVARATGTATVTCYAYNTSFMEYSIWGGQVEEGSFTSSYIPNLSNSQTTRNNDKGNLAGDFGFDGAEGVLEAKFKAFATDNNSRRITLGATDSNRVVLGYGYNNGTVKPYLLIVSPTGIDDIHISMPSSFNIFDYNTYQLKFQSGNNELKINGELVDTDTSFNTLNFTFSASLTNISLNYYNNSSNKIFQGGLKHIKVYDSITDF